MGRRLRREVEPARAQELWSATFVLMGLRYEEDFIEDALKGVTDMEESVTYRAIVEKGRKEGLAEGSLAEARKMVLRLGEKRIGAPSARVQAALEALELPKLEELLLRVNEVSSWEELLGMPAKGRASKR
jgi:predicted transposase YdaD